jgi:DNA-binding MarR family transcriptional regulator
MFRDESDGALAPLLATRLRALVSKLKRRLREQADAGDLTPSQTAALVRLDQHGPLTLSALARAEGVRAQSMSATVAALQAAGLVGGSPDPADGRQTLLALTPACRARLTQGRAARQDWLSRALQTGLSGEELARVAEAVALLERLVADDA